MLGRGATARKGSVAEFGCDLFVGNGPARRHVSPPPLNGLDDVQVVQHVIEGAVVGQAF